MQYNLLYLRPSSLLALFALIVLGRTLPVVLLLLQRSICLFHLNFEIRLVEVGTIKLNLGDVLSYEFRSANLSFCCLSL